MLKDDKTEILIDDSEWNTFKKSLEDKMNNDILTRMLESHLRENGGPGSGRRPTGQTEERRVGAGKTQMKRVKAGPNTKVRRVKALDDGEEFDIIEYEEVNE